MTSSELWSAIASREYLLILVVYTMFQVSAPDIWNEYYCVLYMILSTMLHSMYCYLLLGGK